MSNDNVINHELLVKMNELTTDPRDYAKSLAYYVDHKSSILRELRDRLVSVLKGGVLYVDNDSHIIDESILPREMWYTPVKTTLVSVNGVDYNGDSTILMHAKVIAEVLDTALEQDDPCFIHYKFSQDDYLDSLDEFIRAYATNYSEVQAGVSDCYTIITPYPVDIYDSGDTESVASLGNLITTIEPNVMYTMDPSSIPFDSCIVCRSADSIPTVAIDVIQTLQNLTDTVDTNVTLTACLQGLSTSENLGTAELAATLSTCLGSRVQSAMRSNAQLVNMATDQLVSVESRISSIVSTLRDDLALVEKDDASIDDSLLGLSFNANNYSDTPASAFWTASGASEAFSSAIKVTGAVVNVAARAVCGVVKTIGKGITRLWKRYVTPAIVSKDFIPSNCSTKETYCDVPCLILGDETNAIPFDMGAISEYISNSLTDSTEIVGDINVTDLLSSVVADYDQDHISLIMPVVDGFAVSTDSCLSDGYDDSKSRSLRILCKQKALIIGESGLQAEVTSNTLPLNTFLIPDNYHWVWKIGSTWSRVFSRGNAVPRKAVYRQGHFIIKRGVNETVDTHGNLHSCSVLPVNGNNGMTDYKVWKLHLKVGDSAFDHREVLFVGTPECKDVRCQTAYGSAYMYKNNDAWLLNWDGRSRGAINFMTDLGLVQLQLDYTEKYGCYYTTSYVQVADQATGKFYYTSSYTLSEEAYYNRYDFTLNDHDDGAAVAKYVIEVPEKDWIVSDDGLVITHVAGQSIQLRLRPNGIKYYSSYRSQEYNSGVNMQSRHYSGATQIPLPGIKFAAAVRYVHKTHSDLWIEYRFRAILTGAGVQLSSLVSEQSPPTYYPADGSPIKTQWLSDTQYSYHSAPISLLSKDTIAALFRDASVPFDVGCACVFRKMFGVIEVFNHPGNSNIAAGTRLVAYLSPVNYRSLLDNQGKLRIQYRGEQCYVDGSASDTNSLVNFLFNSLKNVSLLSGSFDYEQGDIEAYKSLYAARVLMDIYLRSIIYPQDHAYLHFSTTDGYYQFKVLTQVFPNFSKAEVNRADLIGVIMHPADLQYTPDVVSEAYKSVNMLAYAVISNKPSFMKSYYYIHGVFPEFIPYVIGDRLEMARWHIATDEEVQNYVENLVTALIVSALVIAAATVIGVAALKAKKALKRKINTSQAMEFNQQKQIYDQVDKVGDLDNQIAQLKKDLSNATDEDTIKQLQDNITLLGAQRTEAKQSLASMQTRLFKQRKRTALWSKTAAHLGADTTPAAVITQYSQEVGVNDAAANSAISSEANVDLTPLDAQFISMSNLITDSAASHSDDLAMLSESVDDLSDLVSDSDRITQSGFEAVSTALSDVAPVVLRALDNLEINVTNANRNGPVDM